MSRLSYGASYLQNDKCTRMQIFIELHAISAPHKRLNIPEVKVWEQLELPTVCADDDNWVASLCPAMLRNNEARGTALRGTALSCAAYFNKS
jgi:hypothetical protein